MLLKLEGTWQLREQLEKLTSEDYQTLRNELKMITLPETQKELKFWYPENPLLDDFHMDKLDAVCSKLQYSRIKGLRYNSTRGDVVNKTITQIHVANLGLFDIKKLALFEDACTDNINEQLKAGWRIIAVIPANNTRRPTYILGTTKE